MERLDNFKKELSNLLKKYNAEIGFYVDDCSDTHGLSGDKMVVYFDENRENHHELNDYWSFNADDLKY